jgi:hypothetical protein
VVKVDKEEAKSRIVFKKDDLEKSIIRCGYKRGEEESEEHKD